MLRGALVGLTLGCFETLIYVVTGHGTFLLRLCTAVLIHTECAALSALAVWSWKSRDAFRPATIAPFVSAVLIHSVYNFFAAFPPPLWWFSVIAILLGGVRCRVCWTAQQEGGGAGSL
jgi:RsiW-degrading membrane proteinase PrsW (M82 family)